MCRLCVCTQLKERQKEDHMYDNTEKFITSAYRRKLEEDKKWQESQRLKYVLLLLLLGWQGLGGACAVGLAPCLVPDTWLCLSAVLSRCNNQYMLWWTAAACVCLCAAGSLTRSRMTSQSWGT